MSVFLKSDLKPVSGGTYFPPEDMYGRRGFKSELLKWVTEVIRSISSDKKFHQQIQHQVILASYSAVAGYY